MNDNKKTLVLSIVGVLVLVLVVVGVSYAMYTFTGTGTKQNVITTGSISVSLDPSESPIQGVQIKNQTITLNNQYPMTDAKGTEGSDVLRFYVAATLSGSTTINYEIGMLKETSTLQDSEVKINLSKVVGTGEKEWLKGSATEGVKVSTFANQTGTLLGEDSLPAIDSYYLDEGSFGSSGIVTYEMKLWVADDYELPTTDTSSGNVHSNATEQKTYSFKIKTFAQQSV